MIKLTAKTKKGKDRIKKWGDKWSIQGRRGNRLFIVSDNDLSIDQDSMRWVDLEGDPDFDVEIQEDN